MNKILYAALLLVGCSYAFTIPNGECQNFTLFNSTDNSTLNETICAGNATVIYNVTNVTNLTIQQCNQTNAVLWANSTGTFNNATISCLFNVTPPVVCNNTTTYVNVTTPIPLNYCFQNTSMTMGYLQVYRNDVCNITIISPSTNSTALCPVCQTCQTCLPYQYNSPCQTCEAPRDCPTPLECVRCPEPVACPVFDNASFVQQLAGKDSIIADYREKQNTLDASIDSKVNAKTGNVNDMYGYALVAGLCCTVFFVWKSRQPQSAPISGIGAAITKERLDKLRAKRGGNFDGGKTVDGKGVEGAAREPGQDSAELPQVQTPVQEGQ